MNTMTSQFKNILVPRFDTHGDIVLLEGFLEALIEEFPGAEITMLVREGYDQLAPLFPEKITWMTTRLHPPHLGYEEHDFPELVDLLERVADISWDLVFVTTYNRTWIEDALSAKLVSALQIAVGEASTLPEWQKYLHGRLSLPQEVKYNKIVPVEEKSHETEKYQALWDEFFNGEKQLDLPRLRISPTLKTKCLEKLAGLGIRNEKYFVCLPGGTQNVSIKNWPFDNFAEVVSWASKEYGSRVVIVGHEDEMPHVEKLREMLVGMGVSASCWLGKNGELPLLAALLEGAEFYVGNDTGPMHITAAVGTPVVGIFGGGTWPRFLPKGSRCVAVASSLPCFGCLWVCIFGDAPCVRLVNVNDVKKAVRLILNETPVIADFVPAAHVVTQEIKEYIEKEKMHGAMYEADRQAYFNKVLACDQQIQRGEAHLVAILSSCRWKMTACIRRIIEKVRKKVQKMKVRSLS